MHQWLGQRGDTNFALLGRLSAHSATPHRNILFVLIERRFAVHACAGMHCGPMLSNRKISGFTTFATYWST